MPYPLVPVEPEAPLHDLIDILSRTTAERAVEPHPQGHHKRKDACTHHGQRTEMPVFAAVGKTAEGTEGIFQGVPSAEMAVRGRDTRRTVFCKCAGKDTERSCQPCRNQAPGTCTPCKTWRIFFLVKIQVLAIFRSLIGNDLETSKILYFTSFCSNSKERFS